MVLRGTISNVKSLGLFKNKLNFLLYKQTFLGFETLKLTIKIKPRER